MQEEERLTLQEAAEELNISENTARRWVKSGKLKAFQPGRRYLIPRSAIDELLGVVSPKEDDLEAWLEERCGHSYLAMESDEIAGFLRASESVEEHQARRRLLTDEVFALDEERKKTSSFIEAEIGGVSYLEVRMRYVTATLVSVEVGALTAKEATRELAPA